MNNICVLIISFFLFNSCYANPKMDYWKEQRKGANFFNHEESDERLKAAKDLGLDYIRLTPSKWLNGREEEFRGDFLIGRPKQYKSINSKDVQKLKEIIQLAKKHDLKVILTLLSIPGARYDQHNHGTYIRKIWEDFDTQKKAIAFWKDLAEQLKDIDNLVGYNLLNEPTPELVKPKLDDWFTDDYQSWYKKVKNTPADLNLFYKKIVKEIRKVDSKTPIILDSGHFAHPYAFKILEPIDDPAILYSFHMYEPNAFTANNPNFSYPGSIPSGQSWSKKLWWDKSQLRYFLKPVQDFQKKYRINNNQILVGEFGVYHTQKGARSYLKDLCEIFNEYQWHWAFYSFREDNWDGMNYELTPKSDKDEKPQAPLINVIKQNLKQNEQVTTKKHNESK